LAACSATANAAGNLSVRQSGCQRLGSDGIDAGSSKF
jgi:hypothetical protein